MSFSKYHPQSRMSERAKVSLNPPAVSGVTFSCSGCHLYPFCSSCSVRLLEPFLMTSPYPSLKYMKCPQVLRALSTCWLWLWGFSELFFPSPAIPSCSLLGLAWCLSKYTLSISLLLLQTSVRCRQICLTV